MEFIAIILPKSSPFILYFMVSFQSRWPLAKMKYVPTRYDVIVFRLKDVTWSTLISVRSKKPIKI